MCQVGTDQPVGSGRGAAVQRAAACVSAASGLPACGVPARVRRAAQPPASHGSVQHTSRAGPLHAATQGQMAAQEAHATVHTAPQQAGAGAWGPERLLPPGRGRYGTHVWRLRKSAGWASRTAPGSGREMGWAHLGPASWEPLDADTSFALQRRAVAAAARRSPAAQSAAGRSSSTHAHPGIGRRRAALVARLSIDANTPLKGKAWRALLPQAVECGCRPQAPGRPAGLPTHPPGRTAPRPGQSSFSLPMPLTTLT